MWLQNLVKTTLMKITDRSKNTQTSSGSGILPANQASAIKAGVYQHFKGNRYRVFGTARHSENEALMVVYAPESNPHELWVRPLTMFEELVETETGETPRFNFVSKHES